MARRATPILAVADAPDSLPQPRPLRDQGRLRDPAGLVGCTAGAVKLADDSGYVWFFADENNVEAVFKVLDGCFINQNYWFFAGGLTNVEVDRDGARLDHRLPAGRTATRRERSSSRSRTLRPFRPVRSLGAPWTTRPCICPPRCSKPSKPRPKRLGFDMGFRPAHRGVARTAGGVEAGWPGPRARHRHGPVGGVDPRRPRCSAGSLLSDRHRCLRSAGRRPSSYSASDSRLRARVRRRGGATSTS